MVVNNRNNPAQDLAMHVRGFGARSAYGKAGGYAVIARSAGFAKKIDDWKFGVRES